MSPLDEKIQSIKNSISSSGYKKPDPEFINKMVENLKENQSALDYLKITRGLSSETIEHFKLGYNKEKDAISIPEYKNGEVVNIKYRHLSESSRQRYSQEKGCEVWVFNEEGFDIGKEKGGILIVEGHFDLMSCWQAGIKNVVSASSGKDSYGIWLDYLDSIPKVFIAYDNDNPGKKSSIELAERIGVEKSFEIRYPEEIKDANDFFQKSTVEDFRKLIRSATPFYGYKFQGVKDVIDSIIIKKDDYIEFDCVPHLKIEEDWVVIVSGVSNVGKTSYVMNIADEAVKRGIPTLVMPFERGIRTVGKRYLQVCLDKTQNELDVMSKYDWEEASNDIINLPLYFSMPGREEIKDIVARAKKIFGVKIVIVDHLDYLVRKSSENHNVETSNTLQEFKALAQEHSIVFILVHHIKKQENIGAKPKKPRLEDLKGSSSIYQDPEAVLMLYTEEKGSMEVLVEKNKGEMGGKLFAFNEASGKIKTGKETEELRQMKMSPLEDF